MEFWLISTAHLEDRLLFKDSEDFKVGMNYVAVQAHKAGINMLAFILMSNHVHFVVEGDCAHAKSFVNGFKGEYSRFLWKKYGFREHLRENGVDIRPLPTDGEALEKAIAYVQMNCVAANICAHPVEYSWGTGGTFFSLSEKSGKSLGAYSARARIKLLHTKADLPESWIIYDDGYISPASYVSKDYVEAIFRTPKRMNFFLVNSSKAKKRLEADEHLPAFRDQVIIAALPDLCQSLFGKRSFSELNDDEQKECVRQIRFRFSSHVNQIARVCDLSYEEVASMMDSA